MGFISYFFSVKIFFIKKNLKIKITSKDHCFTNFYNFFLQLFFKNFLQKKKFLLTILDENLLQLFFLTTFYQFDTDLLIKFFVKILLFTVKKCKKILN